MLSRRYLAAKLLFCLFSATNAFATWWTGTITQTITQSGSTLYQVGQTFEGFYTYESSTVDGYFNTYGPDIDHPNAKTAKLNGSLFLFNLGEQTFRVGWTSDMHMEVINGQVTEFLKHGQLGPSDFWFRENTFRYSYSGFTEGYLITGTMAFGPSHPISDSVGTTLLLGFGLSAVAALSNRIHGAFGPDVVVGITNVNPMRD